MDSWSLEEGNFSFLKWVSRVAFFCRLLDYPVIIKDPYNLGDWEISVPQLSAISHSIWHVVLMKPFCLVLFCFFLFTPETQCEYKIHAQILHDKKIKIFRMKIDPTDFTTTIKPFIPDIVELFLQCERVLISFKVRKGIGAVKRIFTWVIDLRNQCTNYRWQRPGRWNYLSCILCSKIVTFQQQWKGNSELNRKKTTIRSQRITLELSTFSHRTKRLIFPTLQKIAFFSQSPTKGYFKLEAILKCLYSSLEDFN